MNNFSRISAKEEAGKKPLKWKYNHFIGFAWNK